jgi:surface antigen
MRLRGQIKGGHGMRAGRALTIFCVLFGTVAAMPSVEAASTTRQAQKQARPAQSSSEPAREARTTQARQVQSRQARGTTAPRHGIAPQEQAQAALATPAMARGVFAIGTPILPVAQAGGLSCVPFVRMATGMNISGDARTWWNNAAGVYHRGQQPERGAVLAFMGSGGMSRGHVAVVSRVINARTVHVDHSNWGGPGVQRGGVMRGVTVVDVSDRNDWTAVRVQVGWSNDTFGRTYPTHGFIYNRPAGTRTLTASAGGLSEVAQAPAPHAALHLIRATEALAD